MTATVSLRLARGERIKQLRRSRCMSAAGLARAVGVTRSAIFRIEQGLNGISDETLVNVAEVLGVSVSALYEAPEPVERDCLGRAV